MDLSASAASQAATSRAIRSASVISPTRAYPRATATIARARKCALVMACAHGLRKIAGFRLVAMGDSRCGPRRGNDSHKSVGGLLGLADLGSVGPVTDYMSASGTSETCRQQRPGVS